MTRRTGTTGGIEGGGWGLKGWGWGGGGKRNRNLVIVIVNQGKSGNAGAGEGTGNAARGEQFGQIDGGAEGKVWSKGGGRAVQK